MSISAAREEQIADAEALWAFVDPGFAAKSKSCGLVLGDGEPYTLTFGSLVSELCELTRTSQSPLNLVIEAPLSVAFQANGNPVGRRFEFRGGKSRCWYVGLGCAVLTSATYLVRKLTECHSACEVRLIEGFVSFKVSGEKSSHIKDVLALREVVRGVSSVGSIVWPAHMKSEPSHNIESAFAVAGMNYGVPPVILVGG